MFVAVCLNLKLIYFEGKRVILGPLISFPPSQIQIFWRDSLSRDTESGQKNEFERAEN